MGWREDLMGVDNVAQRAFQHSREVRDDLNKLFHHLGLKIDYIPGVDNHHFGERVLRPVCPSCGK